MLSLPAHPIPSHLKYLISLVSMPNPSASATIPHAAASGDFARLEIFSPAKLRTGTGRDVDAAVKALEDALDDSSDASLDAIIQFSLQSPHHHAFGFILSSMSSQFLCAPISNSRSSQIPANAMPHASQVLFLNTSYQILKGFTIRSRTRQF